MEPRTRRRAASSILAPASLIPAIWQSAIKLNPRVMIRRQVMFVVEIVAALATIIFVRDLVTGGAHLGFTAQIFVWLWLTVLFANFAETVAKGRGKAQAAMPRWAGTEMMAKRLPRADATNFETVPTARLRPRDVVLVEMDDLIPTDLHRQDGTSGEVYTFAYNAQHRWYYFPQMTPDEVVLLKIYDSAGDGVARLTAHSAFADPTSPADALPRKSIELRSVVLF